MTLIMADSIVPENLGAYSNFLVYVDGLWPTAAKVRAAHPAARLLTMTVLGGQAIADGCDCEGGDLTPAEAAAWVKQRLAAGAWRPVIYASASRMAEVVAELAKLGIARFKVRLLSAHYGQGQHICGPSTCKATPVYADGTQWTDTAAGVGGTVIDLSVLLDDFFGAPAPVPTLEVDVQVQLGVLEQGSTGQQVRNWQALLVAHGYGYMIAPSPGTSVEAAAGVDGVYGAKTAAATQAFQKAKGIAAGGVNGATWAAALG